MRVLRGQTLRRPGIPGRLLRAALLGGAMLAATMAGAAAQGFGDLVVTPTRLVLDGRQTSEQVMLSNRGAETATFRVSLTLMTMDEDGNLRETDTPPAGLDSAAEMVRFAPRQVVLSPGASQAVRLTVRKPADLAPASTGPPVPARGAAREPRHRHRAAPPGGAGEKMTIE